MTGPSDEHERASRYLMARLERRVPVWRARRLPGWMMPDHLTIIGIGGSTVVVAAHLLGNRDPSRLWLASAGLAIQ